MPACVLIVEDNEVNRYLVRYVLLQAGFEVDEAGEGRSALAAARQRTPDLILLDMSMPGMDGYETLGHLKADPALRDIPVVALTAHTMPHERSAALAAGCVAHIGKPFDVSTFVDRLRPLIEAGRPARGLTRPAACRRS